MFADGEDLRALPLIERKERLQALLAGLKDKHEHIRYVEHLETAGDAVLASACQMELEGIISKQLDAPYESTALQQLAEGQVPRRPGGGHRRLDPGGHEAALADRRRASRQGKNTKLVHVGRVGTGFSEAVMRRLLPELKKVESKTSPFAADVSPRKEANMHWARPELVAEIEFAGWTGDGNVRQAAFKGLRERQARRRSRGRDARETGEDRNGQPSLLPSSRPEPDQRGVIPRLGEAEGPLFDRQEKDPSALLGMTRKASLGTTGKSVMGVTISHPDKPLWPDEKPPVTKLELARYYEADRRLDAAAHPRAGPARWCARPTASGPDLLPAPRHAGQLEPHHRDQGERRQEALRPARPCRSAGRRGADRRDRAASLELPARQARSCPAGWCSTSIRRPTSTSTR